MNRREFSQRALFGLSGVAGGLSMQASASDCADRTGVTSVSDHCEGTGLAPKYQLDDHGKFQLINAGNLSPSINGMRSYHKRLMKIMEEDLDERARLHQDLTRGWYIGTEEGKTDLKLKVEQGVANANRDAKTELESLILEELLSSCLKHLGKGQHDIETDKKSAQWKIAIASHLKASTRIKNPQLCSILNMGHPATMSKGVGIYNKSERVNCLFFKKLTKIALKN